jgi:hypothetical protein
VKIISQAVEKLKALDKNTDLLKVSVIKFSDSARKCCENISLTNFVMD